jgi:hypothetical protein
VSRTNPVVREHGSYVTYRFGITGNDSKNGCRCFPCSDACYRYELARKRARAAGVEAFVDASEVREHLLWLRSVGIGRRAISDRTGIAQSTIKKLADGERLRCRPDTADKLLAVGLSKASAHAYVPGDDVFALVDDLLAMGYSNAELARRMGLQHRSLQLRRESGRITPEKAERIRCLHRELTMERDAQRDWQARLQADYRRRDRTGQPINRRHKAS